MNRPAPLRRHDLAPDPLDQVRTWLEEGRRQGEDAGASMVVATVGPDGTPHQRVLPLRDLAPDGLEVHTDLGSSKGDDLRARPDAVSALLVWRSSLRQLRLECTAVARPDDEADRAFQGRDRRAQLRAWAIVDRRPVTDRAELAARTQATMDAFAPDRPIERPPGWSVVVLVPRRAEVWQADAHGPAHDRFGYERAEGDRWSIRRLVP